jgi:hypothetical protein
MLRGRTWDRTRGLHRVRVTLIPAELCDRGGPYETRTRDPPVDSGTLWPSELRDPGGDDGSRMRPRGYPCSGLRRLAPRPGLEPGTFRLTGGRYCRLSYRGSFFVAGVGFEPTTFGL